MNSIQPDDINDKVKNVLYKRFRNDLNTIHQILDKQLVSFDNCLSHKHNYTSVTDKLDIAKMSGFEYNQNELLLEVYKELIEMERVCFICIARLFLFFFFFFL